MGAGGVGRTVFLVTLGALGAAALFGAGVRFANEKPALCRAIERDVPRPHAGRCRDVVDR